jgi:hypothetical protein
LTKKVRKQKYITGTGIQYFSQKFIEKMLEIEVGLKGYSHESLLCFYWYRWQAFSTPFLVKTFFKYRHFHITKQLQVSNHATVSTEDLFRSNLYTAGVEKFAPFLYKILYILLN